MSKYKLIKRGKGKIKCLRDPETKQEITPADINCSDNLNDVNLEFLEKALDRELSSKKKRNYLFDILDDINLGKQSLIDDPEYEKNFHPVVINRVLSFSPDCIFSVNEVSNRPWISKVAQYKYLQATIRKKKRYIKTSKAEKHYEVEVLSELYNISKSEAGLYHNTLTLMYGAFPQEILDSYEELNNPKQLIINE